MKPFDQNSNSAGEPTDEELDRLAVKRVGQLLKSTQSSSDFLSAAEIHIRIRIIVVLAPSRMRPRAVVEQVLSGLSVTDRKPLRNGLLKFYVWDGDLAEAANYLPKDRRLALSEYEPAMRVHLAGGDLKAAKSVARRCVKLIPVEADTDSANVRDFTRFGLHTALKAYYARIGKRKNAVEFWLCPDFTARYFAEAITGETYHLVVKALSTAYLGIDELCDLQVGQQGLVDTVLGSDESDSRTQAIETLQRLRDSLLHFLPPEEKVRFGGGVEPRFKPINGEEGK